MYTGCLSVSIHTIPFLVVILPRDADGDCPVIPVCVVEIQHWKWGLDSARIVEK